MNIEILRKIVDLSKKFEIVPRVIPEGTIEFEIKYLPKVGGYWPYDGIYVWKRYPELLNDALKQWNGKNPKYRVTLDDIGIDIKDWKGIKSFRYKDYPEMDNLTSKQKTLEVCLTELLSEGLV